MRGFVVLLAFMAMTDTDGAQDVLVLKIALPDYDTTEITEALEELDEQTEGEYTEKERFLLLLQMINPEVMVAYNMLCAGSTVENAHSHMTSEFGWVVDARIERRPEFVHAGDDDAES